MQKKEKAKTKQKLYDKWTEFMNLFSHFSYIKYNEKILHFRNICHEFIVPQGSYGGKTALCLLMNYARTCAKSFHSCLTLWDPMNCSPSGSSVHVILQARMLEWVAMPSSRDLPDPGIEPASLISCIGRLVL